MGRVRVSKNFYLDEFINPFTYRKHGEKSTKFIDKRIIEVAQLLRDLSGKPCRVNTWYKGGNYKNSGYRRFLSTVGSLFSQHKYGRAIDIKVEGLSSSEVVDLILEHKEKFKKAGLTRVEDPEYTPTWVHLDCAFILSHKLYIFKP